MTRVLKGAKKFQALQADLRNRTQQAQQKLEALQKEVQRYQAEGDDPAMPAGRREESARQVRQLRREIEDEQERAKALISKTSGDALVTMYREVEDAVNHIAKANDLELVMFYTDAVTDADVHNPENLQRKISQPGALMPMIVAPGMDITEYLIEVLNRASAPADGPRP
jgi:Skp family chaperone for outer membrane proteins